MEENEKPKKDGLIIWLIIDSVITAYLSFSLGEAGGFIYVGLFILVIAISWILWYYKKKTLSLIVSLIPLITMVGLIFIVSYLMAIS